ncbi:MAG: CsgG/HfaB family protein [Candidatus Latescibacterota bacterium]
MDKGGLFWLSLASIILGILLGAETAFCARVAVIDFESIGDDPNIGRGVTEIVRTELIKTGNYEVVERALLNKIIEEQRFQLSDLVDPTKAVELGKLLGADLILTGSVVKIGTSYTINARFIDVKTGMAKKAEAIRGNEINELTYMSGQLIGILEQEVTPAPAARPGKPVERPQPVARREERDARPAMVLPMRAGIPAERKGYLTFSLGGGVFAMEELNKEIRGLRGAYGGDVPDITGGVNLDFGVGKMVSETVGLGLGVGFLMGATSGSFPAGLEQEITVTGLSFSFRPLVKTRVGNHIALHLGSDIGVVGLKYAETAKSYLGTIENNGSGSGPLLGGFAGGELLLGGFFLEGDVGFRLARGEVTLDDSNATIELDFSGPYMLMTAGFRL